MKGKIDCPDCGQKLNSKLVDFIEQMETNLGFEVTINSGARCSKYNASVGGVKASEHTESLAVDISCLDSNKRFKILEYALINGVTRIGIAKTFIHLGWSNKLPQEVIWLY